MLAPHPLTFRKPTFLPTPTGRQKRAPSSADPLAHTSLKGAEIYPHTNRDDYRGTDDKPHFYLTIHTTTAHALSG